MHPTLDQLLAFRDGEAPGEVRGHVAACLACAAEVERLRKVAADLRALPDEAAPKDLWPALRAEISTQRRRSWVAVAGIAAAVLVAAGIVAAVLLANLKPAAPTPAPGAQAQASSATSDIQPLITESQKLEGIVRKASSGTPVLSGKTAGAIANIEDSIAILDFKISLLKDNADQHDQLKKLWLQRIRLLQALVQVRTSRGEYAQL